MSDAQEIEQPGKMDMLGDSSAVEGLETVSYTHLTLPTIYSV